MGRAEWGSEIRRSRRKGSSVPSDGNILSSVPWDGTIGRRG